MSQNREGEFYGSNSLLEVGRPEGRYQVGRESRSKAITNASFEPNYRAQEVRRNLLKN
jgi:hypothetical protein